MNGGFESGAFSPGWTLTDPDPMGALSNVGSDPLFAHSGTYHANLGTPFPPASPTVASLSQTLSTAPSGMYTLSFWLAHDIDVAPSNVFQVFFNGSLLQTLTNVGTFGYTNFTFAGLIASGPSTVLEFRLTDSDDFFRLDDVSVTGPAGVPESSSTLWLLLPTCCALGLVHRRGLKRCEQTAAA